MIRAFFNERAAIWDEAIAEKDAAKLEGMANRLDIKAGSTVLDVGTGTGIFVPFLLQKIGPTGCLVAIDIAEQMLTVARTKIFALNTEHLQTDVVNLPFASEVFDIVVCYSSFPHFHDKQKALVEIARVLKRSGALFICHTSSRSAINNIHSGMPAVQNDLLPGADEMHQMLSMAGFLNIRIEDNEDSYLAAALKS